QHPEVSGRLDAIDRELNPFPAPGSLDELLRNVVYRNELHHGLDRQSEAPSHDAGIDLGL
ncbi:MAG: hypothetical protein ACYDAD_15885, partial [Acidimicrobiales bacterium]